MSADVHAVHHVASMLPFSVLCLSLMDTHLTILVIFFIVLNYYYHFTTVMIVINDIVVNILFFLGTITCTAALAW